MKRYLLLVISILCITFSSCKKGESVAFDPAAQASIDDAAIKAYILANNITGITRDPSGVYYKVITPGTGAFPTVNNSVVVNYVGTLLDGTQFDKQSSIYFALSGTVKGFQIAMTHINSGGTIQFFVPSGLGYGTVGGAVGANEVLMFNLTLQGFN